MIKAFLYDAKGEDREIPPPSGELPKLEEHHLLWLDVVEPSDAELKQLQGLFGLEDRSVLDLKRADKVPALHNYGKYFQCDVIALADRESGSPGGPPRPPKTLRLDFLVGSNWLVTIAGAELAFLREFRDQDRGETLIGGLSSASLAAALLDWHLTRYLAGLEELEAFVDRLDVRMLGGRSVDDRLLGQVLAGRRFVARLRRNLAPQRTIFYGLSRPDFTMIANSTASEHYKALEHRFERAVDTIEHGRELVQGSFDLFTARVAETTNVLIRRLTFLSLSLGAIGAVAGVFGMNFQTPYTESGVAGFWAVVGGLFAAVVIGGIIARRRNWI